MAKLTVATLPAAAKAFRGYFDALNKSVVGREDIVRLLSLAVAQREHLLVFGPPGTSKTQLCNVAFGNIKGAKKFHVEFSLFMDESSIFGPYDVAKMRDNGDLVHKVDGMLPEANYARFGEFLDANPAVLRSMLGAMNEREMKRGKQLLTMPLMTVFCDTNIAPGDYLKKNPQTWAVLDRIAFMANVDYLAKSEEVEEMIRRFQAGETVSAPSSIDLSLINEVSSLIVDPPSRISDSLTFVKMAEALIEYRTQRLALLGAKGNKLPGAILPNITDRRFVKASQMAETAAVLDGRMEVLPDDLLEMKYILGTTQAEYDLWAAIVNPKITELKDARGQQLNNAQIEAIRAIDTQLDTLEKSIDPADLKTSVSTLKSLTLALEGIRPDNADVMTEKSRVEKKGVDLDQHLRKLTLDQAGFTAS